CEICQADFGGASKYSRIYSIGSILVQIAPSVCLVAHLSERFLDFLHFSRLGGRSIIPGTAAWKIASIGIEWLSRRFAFRCRLYRISCSMDLVLTKLFAVALALGEVTTAPEALKTHFDPVQDRAEVVQILRGGCAHMRQAFDIESINLDDLIATALNDPKAVAGDIKVFHGINFADLNTAYHQFCKNENVANPVVDLGQVVARCPRSYRRKKPSGIRRDGDIAPGMAASEMVSSRSTGTPCRAGGAGARPALAAQLMSPWPY